MGRLTGKTVLITGSGARGSIGRATALELAREGADIAVNDLPAREEEAREVADQIEALGRKACVTLGDVTDVAQCRRIVQGAIDGLGHMDILVNNAGNDRDCPFLEVDEELFDHQVDLHLKGPFFLAQEAAKHMMPRGSGRIINIGSELSYVGEPVAMPYSMAKGGLRTMSKVMAMALAPTITVNTVAPGPTATDEFKTTWEYTDELRETLPLKRFGTPEDVARSVAFLASSDGDAFTGQTLDPNCGAVMD